jgi:hypothetical protein
LNKAVIDVGGWDGREEVYDDDEDGDEDEVGNWNDGGVASGSVMKRIPVETVAKR